MFLHLFFLIFIGVDEIFVEHIKRVLINENFKVEQKPTQRQRSTDSGQRWEVDEKGYYYIISI